MINHIYVETVIRYLPHLCLLFKTWQTMLYECPLCNEKFRYNCGVYLLSINLIHILIRYYNTYLKKHIYSLHENNKTKVTLAHERG